MDKDLFELNVFSLVNLTRVVLRYFLEHGGGQFGVVSSVAGKVGVPNSGTYTASKHALHVRMTYELVFFNTNFQDFKNFLRNVGLL